MQWKNPENEPPPVCQPVLGYSPEWLDPDFNKAGMRDCFLTDEGIWLSAEWDNDQDCWQVDETTKPTLWLDPMSICPGGPAFGGPLISSELTCAEIYAEFRQQNANLFNGYEAAIDIATRREFPVGTPVTWTHGLLKVKGNVVEHCHYPSDSVKVRRKGAHNLLDKKSYNLTRQDGGGE